MDVHQAPPEASSNTERCHCYACSREVQAIKRPDQDLQCPHCQGTSVEILGPQTTAPAALTSTTASRLHLGVTCDGCQAQNFSGNRYHCLTCPDFDLCEACYAQRDSIHHGGHSFEMINTPPALQPLDVVAASVGRAFRRIVSGDGRMPVPLMRQGIVTILEINVEDDGEAQSGLDEGHVAWWLAEEERLASLKHVAAQDPVWTCPICSEGLEAEHSHGWVVRICSDSHGEKGTDESGGHIYHEGCLRRWLVKKNVCPVCRRSPVIPVG